MNQELSMKVSDSQASYYQNEMQRAQALNQYSNIKIEVSNQQSIYQCSHNKSRTSGDNNLYMQQSSSLIGDAHLINCNICGAYFPKSGAYAIRALKRHAQQNKLFISDILRSMYAQCQQKPQNSDYQVKISNQYQEVRNLIIDWLAEVSESLRLDIQKSAYHAIVILDRFLSSNLKKQKKDMEQGAIMLQALCCLFIAAKNLEKDPNVPSSRKFLRQLPGYKPTQTEQQNDQLAYKCGLTALQGGQATDNMKFNSKKNELVATETFILNEIGFDLDSYPTFFDIVEIFMAQGILYTKDQFCGGLIKDDQCTKLIEKYVDYFVLLSLQDHKLVNTNQYLIACAIVSASRKISNISPAWSPELEQLTGLQHSHFCNIEKRLLAKSEQQKAKFQKQQEQKQVQEPQVPKQQSQPTSARPNDKDQGLKNNIAELNGSAILLSNQKEHLQQQQHRQPNHNQEKAQPQVQKPKNERDVSKSNLLGRHQESSLFRNMVNSNKIKYDERAKQDLINGGVQFNLDANVGQQMQQPPINKQEEIRIKYGSQKNKQQYYSSRLQTGETNNLQASYSNAPFSNDQPQSLKHQHNPKFKNEIERNNSQSSVLSTHSQSSNSKIIRKKHQELYHNGNIPNQGSNMQRQKSLVIQNNFVTNSLDQTGQNDESRNDSRNHQNTININGGPILSSDKMIGRANGSLGPQPTSTRASDRPRNNGLIPINPTRNVPPGTGNLKQGQKSNQLYSRELSNAKTYLNQKSNHPRNSSQHSNGSVQSGLSGYQQFHKLGQPKIQPAVNTSVITQDNKSLVRQALKNQKRNQKIAVDQDNSQARQFGATQFGRSQAGSTCGSQNPVNRNPGALQPRVRTSQNSTGATCNSGFKSNRANNSSNDQYEQMSSSKGLQQKSNAPRIANQKLQVNRSLSQSGQKIVSNIPTNSQLIKNKMKAKNLRDDSRNSQNSQVSNSSNVAVQQSMLKNHLSNHANLRANYQQMLPPFQGSTHQRFGSQGANSNP